MPPSCEPPRGTGTPSCLSSLARYLSAFIPGLPTKRELEAWTKLCGEDELSRLPLQPTERGQRATQTEDRLSIDLPSGFRAAS